MLRVVDFYFIFYKISDTFRNYIVEIKFFVELLKMQYFPLYQKKNVYVLKINIFLSLTLGKSIS